MKLTSTARSVLTAAVILALPFGMAPVAQSQTPRVEGTNTATTESPLSDAKQEAISQEISQGFETLFTEVVYENAPGSWSVDHAAAEREGVSLEEAEALAKIMEAPVPSEDEPSVSTRSLKTYAECVVWNFAPVPMSPQDASAIGALLKNKQWKAAADKIVQVASVNGATAALDYGISAIGGPVAWVGKIALYAGSCAVSEKLG